MISNDSSRKGVSIWRGHSISYDKDRDVWLYQDGKSVADYPDRPCGHCGLKNTPEGYDGCLGKLPDVINACCGHGDIGAYIQYENGKILRGRDAISVFESYKED